MNTFFSPMSGQVATEEMSRIKDIHDGKTNAEMHYGPVTCVMKGGLIRSISNVCMPDGQRNSTVRNGMPDLGDWCVQGDDERWIYGTLNFTSDDVHFHPHDMQPARQKYPASSLPNILINSKEACEEVSDEMTAIILYGALASGEWIEQGTGKKWQTSWLQAADTISQMRGLNEPASMILATYNSEREGLEEHEIVMDIMGSLGWEFNGEPDMVQNHKRAAKLVAEHEKLPAGKAPAWYAEFIDALKPFDMDLVSRFNRATYTGRISFDQYYKFWQLFDYAQA